MISGLFLFTLGDCLEGVICIFFLVVMGICCCFFISFFLLYYPGLSCLIIALYRQPRYCLVMYLNSAEDAFTVIIIVSYVLRYLLE